MTEWQPIADEIGGALGTPFRIRERAPVAGGSINTAWRLSDGQREVFLKTNSAYRLDMFQAEAEGLDALSVAGAPRVPRPLATGVFGDLAWLALEWVTLRGRGDWAALGEGLAVLHGVTAAGHGWHRDNTIGSTSQPNTRCADWCAFFARYRLGHQLDLARDGGEAPSSLLEAGARLRDGLPDLLGGLNPAPSLLHGDLWSGNVGFDGQGAPVLFDPAVYFGDRESDLAMAELFGGFPDAFHAAYTGAWPLPAGYPVRRTLYQLYHVLNHANLFGGGYWSRAEDMVRRLLAAF